MSPSEVLPQAKAAATRALEIDDSLGEAHLALARVSQLYDWDGPAVEKEYRRALELNPNDAMAHNWYGEYLQEVGRNEEAFAQMRKAMALDPLSPDSANELGMVFYTARQNDQAIHAFQKALELEPDHVDSHVGLGWAYEEKKMYREAIAELEKAVNLSKRHELIVASLGKVLGDSGRKTGCEKTTQRVRGAVEAPLCLSLPYCACSDRTWRKGSGDCVIGAGVRLPRPVYALPESGPAYG